MERDLVVVGVVGKPFGVHGACYVRPAPDVDHDVARGQTYTVAAGGDMPLEPAAAAASGGRTVEVVDVHEHGRRTVVSFAGVSTREAAEQLRGTVLALERSVVDLPEESLWADEVLGARVVDPSGTLLGQVTALADGPAHDYLVVTRTDGAQVLVPAVADLVTVEPATGGGDGADAGAGARVVVQTIPGLLDPSESAVAGRH